MATAALVSGCIVVPIPENHQFDQGRRTISKLELEQLVPGESTVESVLLTFGEPDIVSATGEKFAYKWHMNKAFWLAILGGDYTAQIFGGDIPEKHLIILSFDEEGILQDFTADEFYIAGMDLKLREQGFTREGKLIVLSSYLPPLSKRQVPNGEYLGCNIIGMTDNRPGFENAPDSVGNFEALGVFISSIEIDMPVEDSIRRLVENETLMLGATLTATEPDWIISGEIVEYRVRTVGFFKLKADARIQIRIRMEPTRSSIDLIESEYIVDSTVPIEDNHERDSIQSALTNCLMQLQEKLAGDLNRLAQSESPYIKAE